MKPNVRFFAFVLLLLPPLPSLADRCTPPSANGGQGIVKITSGPVAGSGVVIAPGLVLTAAHVVEDLPAIDVEVKKKKRSARIIAEDRRIDLALLEVDTRDIAPVRLRHAPPKAKEKVWSIGYRLGKRLTTGEGRVRGDANHLLYTSAPVDFGQSGGGLMSCENGQLVLTGILRAFGAEKRNGKLVRRDDVSVATRLEDTRRFVSTRAGLVTP